MDRPIFLDTRLTEVVQFLECGTIKLLSLDIFDTLLMRRVPNPPDVFLRLGLALQKDAKLGPNIEPDSFAAIRYQTEYAARGKRQRVAGDREITLHEIYALFPPQAVHENVSIDDLVARELTEETRVTFAMPEVLALAAYAKSLGIELSLISNSYIEQDDLMALVRAHAPDLPEPNAVFVSCSHRMGKRTGLMKKMCHHFSLAPSQALHLGDNPISDRLAAQEIGMRFVDMGTGADGFDTLLTDEHPRQWRDRSVCYGEHDGDYGMNALRRQAGFWALPTDIASIHAPFYRYGSRMMGPLLAGFSGWAAQRIVDHNGSRLFGLLREGEILTRLVRLHAPALDCGLLATSRIAAALACFTPDTPQYLEDFLTRRGFWSVAMLMQQLGFTREQAAQIVDPDATLDTIPAPELTQRLIGSPLATQLYERSAARRKRLLAHLQSIGALGGDKLYLLDLGYAATIQRGLQRILAIEKLPITTHGFYMAAAHVSLNTQMEGGIVEGFLAQNGNPNDFACAFCRSPEIVEQCCMPPYGSATDYREDGTPLFDSDNRPQQQIDETAITQRGIMDFAARFADQIRANNLTTDFAAEGWRQQMRALALRMIVHPTKEEAQTFGHWLSDSDMGLSSPRPIVSAGQHQDARPSMSASALFALPRREVPWLCGVAATISPALCRRVARLVLRHEWPESFD